MQERSVTRAEAGKMRALPAWAKGVLFFIFLLVLLEAGLRLAGLIYSGARPSVFGGGAGAFARTVLCVGDSYTFGGNVTGDQAYPSPLWLELEKAAPGTRVVNKGHCEYNSSQVLAELPKNLETYKPEIVILLAGSSDRWNIIGEQPGDSTFIYRPDYDGSVSDGRLWPPEPRSLFADLRVHKMARTIYLNAKFRYLLRNAAAIDPKKLAAGYKAGKFSDRDLSPYMAAMYYNSRYENLFELALEAIENVPAGSAYYAHSLSYYFALAFSFEFQSKYPAEKVVERFKALLARRPELERNEAFMKYLRYFMDKKNLEAFLQRRLAENLDAIAGLVKASGARLVVLNYPSTHTAANRALERAAAKHKAVFIDVHSVFSELIAKDGRAKYLMGDDHATPLGHEAMAALILPEVVKALK